MQVLKGARRAAFRPSSLVLLAAGLVGALALVVTVHESRVNATFSRPTATVIGTVISHAGSKHHEPGLQCWVRYTFTVDGRTYTGFSFWMDACGLKTGGPTPVQYLVADPRLNRPPDGGLPMPSGLLWFATGVLVVIGIIRRSSDAPADEGPLVL